MTFYAWIKLLHVAAIAMWSAGLVYLPALFAEHARTEPGDPFRRLRHRTRLTYVVLTSPAAVIAVVTGTIMIPLVATMGIWLVYKLAAVGLMVLIHVYFGRLMGLLYDDPGMRRPGLHLALLVPVVVVISLVLVAVTAKPI
jgi:protoporphyrinogen IX oxidase